MNRSTITTVTGKHVDPLHPAAQDLDMLDIAHALSLLCRGGGQTKTFYSVAQHSMACAEEANLRGHTSPVILGCLLHDACEAYLSAVTRPVKRELPQYLQAEKALQDAIFRRFIGRAMTEEEQKKIADIDDCMLSMEYHRLMPEELNGDYQRLKNPVVCRTALPETVRDRFLVFAAYGYEDFSVHSALEDEAETVLAACAPDTEPSAVRGTLWVMEHDADPIGCGYVDKATGKAVLRFASKTVHPVFPVFLRSAVLTAPSDENRCKDRRRCDGKPVRLTTTQDEVFFGIASHHSAEYCFHEFGRDEEALQIGCFIFYPQDIRDVQDWRITSALI